MSDKKKMDEFLQQSFSDYSPDVSPHIWDNIAAERKKKRPVAFWLNKGNLLLLAALLIAIGGTTVWMMQKTGSKNISLEANSNGSKQVAEKSAPAPVAKNDGVVNTENSNSNSALNINGDGNTQTAIAGDNNPGISKTKAQSAAGSNGKNQLHKTVAGSLIIDDKNSADNVNDLFRNKDKNKFIKKSSTTSTQRISLADDMAFDKAAAASDNQNEPLKNESTIPALQGSKEQISINSLLALGKQQTIIKKIDLKIPDCPAAEKDAAGNKSYVEVYLGPDYAFKSYSDTGNSELIRKRKESLHFQSAYSAGIRYTRVFGNGMSIRAGINFSQINEKFSFIKDNVVQQVYVINPQGDTTSSYYVRGTRYSNAYNHYRSIDVPVVVGYELGNGRLHANINAGVMINVYSWQKGQTLDDNYLPVSITTGKEGNTAYQYKTNVGIGFTGAVSLYYKLNDRLHLLAEPYCRFNLSPMNKEAVSLQEKFTSIGLRLGLRMDF
jgi:hypothetical protein